MLPVLSVIWLTLLAALGSRRRGRQLRPALAGLLLAAALACGGGNGPAPPSQQPPPGGLTAPGTYQITITGTSGAVQRSTTVSLTVQ
jgi:hypothetical protein